MGRYRALILRHLGKGIKRGGFVAPHKPLASYQQYRLSGSKPPSLIQAQVGSTLVLGSAYLESEIVSE